MNLAVVLQDVGGSAQVQHTIDDQLAVAGKVVALPLQESDLCLLFLLLALTLTVTWVDQSRKKTINWRWTRNSNDTNCRGRELTVTVVLRVDCVAEDVVHDETGHFGAKRVGGQVHQWGEGGGGAN